MNMADAIYPLILSLVAGLATLFGAWLGRFFHRDRYGLEFGLSFAGTLMIIIAFFDLLPGAWATIGYGRTIIAGVVGVFGIMAVNRLLPHIHAVKDFERHHHSSMARLAFLVAIGLIMHDFPEGFAIASSYFYSITVGIMVTASLFLHNIPEGYILSATSRDFIARRHFYLLAFSSVAATFFGTLLGICLTQLNDSLNPILSAVAAGVMVYISLHELMPLALRFKKIKLFVSGAAMAVIIYFLLEIILV